MSVKNIISIIFYSTIGLMALLTLITALSMWYKGLPVPPGLLLTGVLLTTLFVMGKMLLTPKEERWKKDL